MTEALAVLLGGRVAGRVERSRGRGLRFVYDDGYAAAPAAVPLSLSMRPQERREFGDRRVAGWLSNLLPGHPDVRALWADRHAAASAQPFDLLATPVGLECAGAVQFCRPDRVDDTVGLGGSVEWLSDRETEEMVEDMVRQSSIWGRRLGASAFSLAGAHAKVALYRDEAQPRRWAETTGNSATTHILKPPIPGQPEQAINEHLCMATARRLGLVAAPTEIQTWAGHEVLVVRRFDRVRSRGGVRRVHQEDLYQAAGDYAADIYQGDSGEGHSPADLAGLLADHASDPPSDLAAFFDALAFNWLICNTDAHAKNYSVLLGPGDVRFAPLYDIWSNMGIDDTYLGSHTLAMSALADRRILAADSRHAWEATAAAVGIDPDDGVARVVNMLKSAPAALDRAIDDIAPAHRRSPVVRTLADGLKDRASACIASMASATSSGRSAPRLAVNRRQRQAARRIGARQPD